MLQIYTATNAKARELLNDRIVSEIAMKWRIYFGPNKHSNALGLLHIIDDYRSANPSTVDILLTSLCHLIMY